MKKYPHTHSHAVAKLVLRTSLPNDCQNQNENITLIYFEEKIQGINVQCTFSTLQKKINLFLFQNFSIN